MSLAFIPPEDVEEGYKCIEASFEDEEFDQRYDRNNVMMHLNGVACNLQNFS